MNESGAEGEVKSEARDEVTFGKARGLEVENVSRETRAESIFAWPGWSDWRWRGLGLAVVVLGILLRGLVLSSPLVLSGDAEARYVPLATNLWQGRGYSRQLSAPFRPDSFDQPGYPMFLAAVLEIDEGNLDAVVAFQLALETGIVFLIFAITDAAGLSRAVRLWALAIALICPFLPLWSGRAMTEIATTFCLSVLCWLCVQAARGEENFRWWSWAGLAGALCLMVRADTLPAVALMLLFGALAQWRRGGKQRVRRLNFHITKQDGRTESALRAAGGLSAALLILALTMAPWTWRNYRDFHELLPLGRVGEQQRNGYVVWLGTWVDDTRFHKPLWWDILKPDHDIRFPATEIPDAFERAQAVRGVELARKRQMFAGSASQLFFELAAQARQRAPLRTRLLVPIKRTAMTWLRMADYTPITAVRGFARDPARPHIPRAHEEFFIALISCGWHVLLGLALLGMARSLVEKLWLCAPLWALIIGRSLLPFVSGIGTEPRYMIEALPAVFVFGALGAMALVKLASKYLPGNQGASRITRHGLPAAMTLAGISLVTTLPAPITVFSPIVTPGSTIAPPPIHTLSPMVIGDAYSNIEMRVSTSSG